MKKGTLIIALIFTVFLANEGLALSQEEMNDYENMVAWEMGLQDADFNQNSELLDYYFSEESNVRIEYVRYLDNSSDYIRTYGLCFDQPTYILRYFDNDGNRMVDRIEMTFMAPGFYQFLTMSRADNSAEENFFISADRQLKEMEVMAAAVA